MTHMYRYPLIALLVAAIAVASCNDDDPPSSPTGPQDNEQPGPGDNGGDNGGSNGEGDEAAAFLDKLSTAMADVIPLLLLGGGELEGDGGGVVVVEGTVLSFQDYSPDGETVMNGPITINPQATPWTITGTLTLSGASEGEVVVAMTLNPLADPPAPGGTVTIDGIEYDVAALAAENADG